MPKSEKKKNDEAEATPTEEEPQTTEQTVEERAEELVERAIAKEAREDAKKQRPPSPKFETAPSPDFTLKSNAGDLKNLLNAVDVIVDEPIFDVSEDGLGLRGMDPSRVAMVTFLRPPASFDLFEVRKSGRMCINSTELLKFLKRAGNDDGVVLILTGESARLHIEISGKYLRVFHMPTLEAGTEEIPVPKVDLTTNFKIASDGFLHAIEDCNLVSDHMKIATNTEGIHLKATGDVADADIDLHKGDDYTLAFFSKEKTIATFSLSYLTDIVKAGSKIGAVCTLEYAKDMPCKIEFDGQVAYWLAPRIERD